MLFAVLLAIMTATALGPSYEGRIHLPFDLAVGNQQILKKDTYQIAIVPDPDGYSLNFLEQGKPAAVVKGSFLSDPDSPPPTMPATGTLFLRSTDLPVLTDEERHYSRTGRPQYEEATRDWEATLRVYEHLDPENPEVHFVFQRRDEDRRWDEVRFILKRVDRQGSGTGALD